MLSAHNFTQSKIIVCSENSSSVNKLSDARPGEDRRSRFCVEFDMFAHSSDKASSDSSKQDHLLFDDAADH